MLNEFRHNHYVPEWYQARFTLPGQPVRDLAYLDMSPGFLVLPGGGIRPRRALQRRGHRLCFAESDLYTRRLGSVTSVDIEKYFFGDIDRRGRTAVEYFTSFSHPSVPKDEFLSLVSYMSTQKLRTPKGLAWLRTQFPGATQKRLLEHMVRYRDVFSALWTECVWQIADCEGSDTKFIVSDHPVTVYNRACAPASRWCRGVEDPSIALCATHTLFPLSYEKILILTNLTWARNPYQGPQAPRPNPNPLRSAIKNFHEVQTHRQLEDQEVRQINLIIKSRALRYVAAAREEWLFPERTVSVGHWRHFGGGYLLMPDPRPLMGGGTIMWGGPSGLGGARDEYGRLPSDPDFEKEAKGGFEFEALQAFKGEFAHRFGPERRGRAFEGSRLSNERDSDSYHQHHLELYDRYFDDGRFTLSRRPQR